MRNGKKEEGGGERRGSYARNAEVEKGDSKKEVFKGAQKKEPRTLPPVDHNLRHFEDFPVPKAGELAAAGKRPIREKSFTECKICLARQWREGNLQLQLQANSVTWRRKGTQATPALKRGGTGRRVGERKEKKKI